MRPGIMFHTDAVQAVGKVPIDLKNTKIDMLSLSGHKLHAPKGIGVLYLRRGYALPSAAARRPSGTRSACRHREHRLHRRPRQGCELALAAHGVREHRGRAPARQAGSGHPGARCRTASSPATRTNRLPNTSNIAFEYIEGEAILLLLNKLGIAAASTVRPAPPARWNPRT